MQTTKSATIADVELGLVWIVGDGSRVSKVYHGLG
ncbi:hypothetical protein ACP70R_048661 [Stipagrostis hirtigluma subsp. patula]